MYSSRESDPAASGAPAPQTHELAKYRAPAADQLQPE